MKFIKIKNESDGAKILAAKLSEYLLQNKKVLWLLSGGSNISIAVEVLNILKEIFKNSLKNNLAVTLTDERFGSVGHSDSNWQQLIEAGFDIESLKSLPILGNLSIKETVKKFEENYKELVGWADIVIGQFGIGSDGHTAGVLPGTIGVTSSEIACNYDGGKYKRISLTLNTIKNINIAYIFALGESKKEIIKSLQNKDLSLFDMPAQILKQIAESYLYFI